jgi:uncharacterized membrane protein (UPF0127 family)
MSPLTWSNGEGKRSPGSTTVSVTEKRLVVTNQLRSTVLATSLEVADTGPKRNKGLLGRDGLAPGGGLWIVPCESVHTFFMRFPIDLVYLDRSNTIRKVRSSVGAWRMSACLSAHSILELPAGTIHATQTQVGDVLEFAPASAPVEVADLH